MISNFVYYQNVRGLRSKVNEFYRNALATDFDIVCLTETWLDESVYSAELFPDEWSVFRQDGKSKVRGRGVLVAVRDSAWHAEPLPTLVNDDNISLLWLKLNNPTGFNFYLCTIYVAPNSSLATYNLFFQSLDNRFFINDKIVIIGDFNLPLILNSKFNFRQGGELYIDFKNFLQFNNFNLHNDIVNIYNRTLDLVISNLDGLSVEKCSEVLVPIDRHHPVLSISLVISKGKWHAAPPNESNYNFKNVDFSLLYQTFKNADWNSVLDKNSLDEAVDCFYNVLYSCLNSHTRARVQRLSKYPAYYSADIISVLKRKEKFRNLYKRSRNPRHLEKFRQCRSNFKRLVKQSYDNFVRRTEDSLAKDPKQFWSFINSKKVSKLNPSGQNFVWENEVFDDGLSTASGFARYFGSVYERGESLDPGRINDSPVMNGVNYFNLRSISVEEVTAAIRKLPSKRSYGPDLIPVYIIKGCSEFLEKPLCHIFNRCLASKSFPDRWKVTKITPILKKGSRLEISNYRPVAVLSTPAKVFELIIFDHVFSHMKQYICQQQHGFMPSRSINTNLVNFVHFTSFAMDSRHQVDVIYTDMSKAFDKVDHFLLLKKMNFYGFSGDLINFFISYLQNRRQYVSFSGYKSDIFLAGSGVPQGSNLGPLCFNIFINDLSFILHSKFLMYADDLKIYSSIKVPFDCDMLQNDLDSLHLWCTENKLNLNIAKCSTMTFYRILNPIYFPYNINGIVLERVERFKDLGVLMTFDLQFNDHIINLVNRSLSTLGFITRTCKLFQNPKTFVTLYQSLVRSKLEFASIVWSPFTALYTDIIERVQKRFLRSLYFKVHGVYIFPIWSIRYDELLSIFNFDRLDVRRKVASLCFLRGVMSGSVDDAELLACVPWYVPRRGGRVSRLVYIDFARTVGHATSPLLSAFKLLNTVANNIDLSWNSKLFKIRCLETVRLAQRL